MSSALNIPLQCTVDWAESILLATVVAALIYCGWCIEFLQLAVSVTGAVSQWCWCIVFLQVVLVP